MTNLAENLTTTTSQGDLARELQRLRDAEGVTFAAIANKTGISRSAISQLVNQGLRMKPEHEKKLWDAVNEIKGTEERLGPDVPVAPIHFKTRIELFETKEFKECMGWCNYVCSKRKMGVMVGHPGSGKTTVAVRLAKYLADKRRNVILLLCDMTAPMLPCICPAADLECERSLGSVLAAAHVSENLVKNNLVTHKRLGYLTMLGMLKGENEYTYPPYNEVQARELIDCLREIAPYVVIDCGSYIANDILSAVALMEADSVLRLANADLKSISYLSSQLPLLRDAKWDTDKQYKTASNVKSQQAGDHMSQALGTVAFTLPHSAELEGQYLAGNLLADLSMKDSRVFRKEIEKIAREVFGC